MHDVTTCLIAKHVSDLGNQHNIVSPPVIRFVRDSPSVSACVCAKNRDVVLRVPNVCAVYEV